MKHLIGLLVVLSFVVPQVTALADIPPAADPLDGVIDRLALCESSQTPDVIVMDTNQKLSYGWLQFQEATFNWFGEKYNLPHSDILSPKQQIAIAKRMLADGLWQHWFVCLNKYHE